MDLSRVWSCAGRVEYDTRKVAETSIPAGWIPVLQPDPRAGQPRSSHLCAPPRQPNSSVTRSGKPRASEVAVSTVLLSLTTQAPARTCTLRGIPTYKFRYKSAEHSPSGESTTEYIGTMAQDLVELEPSAVSVGTDGFYRVDYSKIDVDFKAVA